MGLRKVLIIGPTGTIGKHMVSASVKQGNPTFALVRTMTPSDPAKAEFLKSLQDSGVTLLVGDIFDHDSLVAALKQVEAVIAPVSGGQITDQLKIIDAAKEAGTIKRFYPSEFGNQIDRIVLDVPITKAIFEPKLVVRRALEESGIPYTYVASNCFFTYFLNSLGQDNISSWPEPPRDGKLIIYGDGNTKAIFNDEVDIAKFTLKSVDDPRAANKNLIIRLKENVLTQNEIIALWENKIGHTFEKEIMDKDAVLKSLGELPFPKIISRALSYSIFVKGDQTLALDPATEVDATALYPDVEYTTVDEYWDGLV